MENYREKLERNLMKINKFTELSNRLIELFPEDEISIRYYEAGDNMLNEKYRENIKLGPMGWIGPDQTGPPDHAKAIYIALDREYSTCIEESFHYIKCFFLELKDLRIFHKCSIIEYRQVIERQRYKTEIIFQPWYDAVVKLIDRMDIDNMEIEQYHTIEADCCQYKYDNTFLIKERKRVLVKEEILGDQRLKFTIGIPMIDEVCNDETIENIIQYFSTID